MGITTVLIQLTAGLRIALILFAFMALLAWYRIGGEKSALERYRRIAWLLQSVSVICYSPAHASWLLGHPFRPIISRSLDAIATSAACGCFIALLASRGLMRGLSQRRVIRGVYVNVAILFAVVGAAWLTR